MVLRPDNQIGLEVSDPLPDRLTADRLQPDRLRNGETTSGSVGNKVWAAAPLSDSQGASGVVVLTRSVDRALGPAVGWFLLASLVAILVAALVAYRLAKQLTKPLRSATDATARIAAGDLSVRLPSEGRRHGRDHRALPSDQPDGRHARAVARSRETVPAVGVARPAYAAHVDPWLCRGDR